jgi:hypothetical protein
LISSALAARDEVAGRYIRMSDVESLNKMKWNGLSEFAKGSEINGFHDQPDTLEKFPVWLDKIKIDDTLC